MRLRITLVLCLFILLSSVVTAQVDFENLQTYQDFSREIPDFNAFLKETPLLLPPLVLRIANDEDVAVHVSTNSGHIESFVIGIYENYVTHIYAGPQPTKLYIEIDEPTLDDIIAHPETAIEYYKDGTIQIKSTSIVKKAKLFVMKKLALWFG